MSATRIVYKGDPNIVVYIDREQASAPVQWENLAFKERDSEEEWPLQPTPFQTADMPWNDQLAAAMVDQWIEMQGG